MSNAGGSSGKYSYASKDKQWAAFDRLPRSVRDALNNAAFDWAPYTIERRWQRGEYRDATDLVRAIARWDKETIAKLERKRERGNRRKRGARGCFLKD